MHDYTNYLIFVLYKKDTKKIIPNHTHTHTHTSHNSPEYVMCCDTANLFCFPINTQYKVTQHTDHNVLALQNIPTKPPNTPVQGDLAILSNIFESILSALVDETTYSGLF